MIDNRPSWHPLRLCVKFGSQGDHIGTENLFQPSVQTGSFDVILAKRILRAEDPGGVLPRILDRGVPRRFVNPNPI